MHISILTFDGFNELDSLIAFGILNRVQRPDWRVTIACPEPQVRSMNGLQIERQVSLSEAVTADAVIIGSGIKTREVVADPALMAQLKLDPSRQLIAAQCSGALVLAKLGLVDSLPVSTDLTTRPWVADSGVEVLEQPLVVRGNIASAGGCLASEYLGAWVLARLAGVEEAISAIDYVAPVGEKEAWVKRMLRVVEPCL